MKDSKQNTDKSVEVVGNITTASSGVDKLTPSQVITNAFYDSVAIPANIKDGRFNNPVLNLGISDPALNGAEFGMDMVTFNRQVITEYYHGSWVFRRAIDKVAQVRLHLDF